MKLMQNSIMNNKNNHLQKKIKTSNKINNKHKIKN